METKETMQKCCGGKMNHKKILVVFVGIILLVLAALVLGAASWKFHQENLRTGMMYGWGGDFNQGRMMNGSGKVGGFVSTPPAGSENQFVLPMDASKSGEIAIVVNDLEASKKAVSDIAAKNGGSVYATFISYASSSVKNGSIVVQIPVENFDQVFAVLKSVGSRVVQESTQQIPSQNYYLPMAATSKIDSTQSSAGQAVPVPVSDAKPEIAVYPNPTNTQFSQNKGYVKVVFVDYGGAVKGGDKNEKGEREFFSGNILGVGNPATEGVRNNLLIIVGVKLILLVAIVGLLLVMLKKIFHRAKRQKESKTKVHVVRQLSKTHKRVVKIQAKKKK